MIAGVLPANPLALALAIVLLPCVSFVALTIYNLCFHPLRKFPGPWYARASILWWEYHLFRGDLTFKVKGLHHRYGEVVRVAPNELSFTNPQAWKDIYGQKPGKPENIKDPSLDFDLDHAHPSIFHADSEKHSLLRKLLAPGFADKALKEQESLLVYYADLLVKRLSEKCDRGLASLDLVEWYNFTTFDIIGHLAFDEPFDCLKKSDYHPWVRLISGMIKYLTFIRAINRLRGGAAVILMRMLPASLKRKREENVRLTRETTRRRMEKTVLHTDLMTHLIEAGKRGQLEFADLYVNAGLLIGAGSETIATLLSGATYFLATNLHVLETLKQEVRSSFTSSEDITIHKVNQLKYMLAVLDESFRLYPPAANSQPRRTPKEGLLVNGVFIPGDSMVGIYQYAAFRSASNFKDADDFIAERWLDDPMYKADRRDVVQPFAYGPRNCIGKSLANIEIRLILTKILWNFDFELMPDSANWIDHKIFMVWEKPPLWVRLTPVRQESENPEA